MEKIICENCQLNPGEPYNFFYGREIEKTEVSYRVIYSNYKVSYQALGPVQVFLCEPCIKKKYSKSLTNGIFGAGIILIACLIMWSLVPLLSRIRTVDPNLTGIFVILGIIFGGLLLSLSLGSVIALIFLIMMLIQIIQYYSSGEANRDVILKKAEAGEKLAMDRRRQSLKKQGFPVLWTPSAFGKLQKRYTEK